MNADRRYVLTFDCGTQSTRALLFDDLGALVCKAKVTFEPYFSIENGWAEQHAEFYYDRVCEASLKLKELCPELFDRIEGIAITTIRDTFVQLDKEGKPVRPMIVWMDQRTVGEKKLDLKSRFLFGLTGMTNTARTIRMLTKAHWLMEHEPEGWAKTYKYMELSGYINYRMTGNMADAVAAQIGHVPFDYKRRRWNTAKSLNNAILGYYPDKLPQIVETGGILGYITEETSSLTGIPKGLPVFSAGSDKGCETLGTGCMNDYTASVSFGTTATIQFSTKKHVEPQQFMPAYPAIIEGFYNPEIQIYRGYWMLTWFKSQFAHKEEQEAAELNIPCEELFNQRMQAIPPGSDGLIVQPFWTPGLKQPESKGSVIGFTDAHTKVHLYRAIVEGLGFELMYGLKSLEKRARYKIRMLTVSGGGASSDHICQLTADMFGLPVYRVQTHETSGLGAAIVCFLALKRFKDYKEAIAHMVHYKEPFNPDPEAHSSYEKLYSDIYVRIYKRLKPLFVRIRKTLNQSFGGRKNVKK